MTRNSQQRCQSLRLILESVPAPDAAERLRHAYDVVLKAAARADDGEEEGGEGDAKPNDSSDAYGEPEP